MEFVEVPIKALRRLTIISISHKVFELVLLIASVSALWNIFQIVNSAMQIPLFAVSQYDMRPAINAGDIAIMYYARMELSDIVLFRHTPIHRPSELLLRRVVYMQKYDANETRIMTKADFNLVDDRFIYLRGKPWDTTENVLGKVRFTIPYLGMLSIGKGFDQSLYRSTIAFLIVVFVVLGQKNA